MKPLSEQIENAVRVQYCHRDLAERFPGTHWRIMTRKLFELMVEELFPSAMHEEPSTHADAELGLMVYREPRRFGVARMTGVAAAYYKCMPEYVIVWRELLPFPLPSDDLQDAMRALDNRLRDAIHFVCDSECIRRHAAIAALDRRLSKLEENAP